MKTSKLILTLGIPALLLAVGCATAKMINGPDGTPHQLIYCGTIEECYNKAAQTCLGKYTIVNTSTTVVGGNSNISLLVKCEKQQ